MTGPLAHHGTIRATGRWRCRAVAVLLAALPASTAMAQAGGAQAGGAQAGGAQAQEDGPVFRQQNDGHHWSFSKHGAIRRYELREDSRYAHRNDPRQRSESLVRNEFIAGHEYTIDVALKVDPGEPNRAAWLTLIQFQSRFDKGEDGHSPPFAVELKGERMEILTRTSAVGHSTRKDVTTRKLFADAEPITRDKWYHMHITICFDPGGNGLLHVERDGRRIVDYHGPIGFKDARGPYYKQGVYRRAADETMSVRFRGPVIRETGRCA